MRALMLVMALAVTGCKTSGGPYYDTLNMGRGQVEFDRDWGKCEMYVNQVKRDAENQQIAAGTYHQKTLAGTFATGWAVGTEMDKAHVNCLRAQGWSTK